MRARADFYVSALVRWADQALVPIAIRHRGDRERGLILIVQQSQSQPPAVCLWVQASDEGGQPCWRPRFEAPQTVADADAFIARERGRDEDLWVIDLESRADGGAMPDLPPVLSVCRQR